PVPDRIRESNVPNVGRCNFRKLAEQIKQVVDEVSFDLRCIETRTHVPSHVSRAREAQARQRSALSREAQARQRSALSREAQARQRAALSIDRWLAFYLATTATFQQAKYSIIRFCKPLGAGVRSWPSPSARRHPPRCPTPYRPR